MAGVSRGRSIMLPQRINDEVNVGKLTQISPYCLLQASAEGDVAWIGSSPLTNKTIDRKLSLDKDNTLSGTDTYVQRCGSEIVLKREQVVLRFAFSFISDVGEDRGISQEGCRGKSESDCGTLYPTANGFAIEGNSERKIKFSSSEPVQLYNLGDYCLIFDRNNRPIFTINYVLKGAKARPNIRSESNGTEHKIEVEGGNDGVLNFHGYAPKCIYDTLLDANDPSRNHAFAENAYLGSEKSGGQWLALRPDCGVFSCFYDRKIKKAHIIFQNLNGGRGRLFYGLLRFYWCTFTTTWETREIPQEWREAGEAKSPCVEIDITEYLKRIFHERAQATPGLVICAESKEPLVLSTGDNELYPVLIRIEFERLAE